MRVTGDPMRSLLLLPALVSTLWAQDLPVRLQAAQRLRVEQLRTLQADLAAANSSTGWKVYHECNLAYGLITQLREKDPKGAEALLDRTIKALEGRKDGESLALLGSCLGVKMGFSPVSAMVLSSRAAGLFEAALKQSPTSPRVLMLKGISVLYTPTFFGGGAAKAMPILESAVKAAEAEAAPADPWAPSWGRAEAHTWLALAQLDAKQFREARLNVDKALALDPGYGFARFVVLPKLQSKVQ
jgi:hypothetical protein